MQPGNCNFNKLNMGIEPKPAIRKEEDEAGDEFFDTEDARFSPPKVAHLGFHDQPTKTPIITAIHRGAMNIISSPTTSVIVGLCKISRKTENKAMSIQKYSSKRLQSKDYPERGKQWIWRRTLDSIESMISVSHGDDSRVSAGKRERTSDSKTLERNSVKLWGKKNQGYR